jgi:hypothetical protein
MEQFVEHGNAERRTPEGTDPITLVMNARDALVLQVCEVSVVKNPGDGEKKCVSGRQQLQ